jgi:NADH-quinone oxidoreductase subunit J
MNGSTIIFYLLAALTVGSALLSVTSRNIFRSAIFLLFSLIGIAGIYFWLQYDFIAAVQIIVYVGGIVVLIIFSIFLTQQAGEKLPAQKLKRKIFSVLAAVLGFALVMLQINRYTFSEIPEKGEPVTVAAIGKQLLNIDKSGLALPFEIISILLLAAMVGCIVIAMRQGKTIIREETN